MPRQMDWAAFTEHGVLTGFVKAGNRTMPEILVNLTYCQHNGLSWGHATTASVDRRERQPAEGGDVIYGQSDDVADRGRD